MELESSDKSAFWFFILKYRFPDLKIDSVIASKLKYNLKDLYIELVKGIPNQTYIQYYIEYYELLLFKYTDLFKYLIENDLIDLKVDYLINTIRSLYKRKNGHPDPSLGKKYGADLYTNYKSINSIVGTLLSKNLISNQNLKKLLSSIDARNSPLIELLINYRGNGNRLSKQDVKDIFGELDSYWYRNNDILDELKDFHPIIERYVNSNEEYINMSGVKRSFKSKYEHYTDMKYIDN